MIKILCVLFPFLLLCSSANAFSPAIQAVLGFNTVTAACTTPTGDELTESFGDSAVAECWTGLGGTTCNQTWTVTAGTPEMAESPAGAPSNTACTNAYHFDAAGGAVNIRKDLGAGTIANNVAMVVTFSLYIDSASLAAYANVYIVSFTASTSMTDSNNYFSFRLYKSTAGTGTPNKMYANSSTGALNFSTGTWYNITITLDAAGAADGSTMTDGLGNTQTFTRNTVASRYLYAGAHAANVVGYIGNITVATP